MNDSTASYPFPVMGAGRLDYVSGCSYATLDWSVESGHVKLTHQIEGDSLISQLIAEDNARFGCVVVIPSTMYRFISLCSEVGALTANHAFDIEKKNRSIHIVKFLPLIFYKGKEQEFIGDSSSMGIDDIWDKQKFTLQKGAIIARDSWREISPGLSHLLNVQEGKFLPKGMMDVDIADADGGYFQVFLSSDLYNGFQWAKTQEKSALMHRDSILTHALGSGLARLASKDSGGSDWDALENFQALKRNLKDNHDMSWDNPEEFDPHKAACAYLPHCLESIKKVDED